jgi:hypothetical protein
MELDRDGDYRHVLRLHQDSSGRYMGSICRFLQPVGEAEPPRYGSRFPVGSYANRVEAFEDGRRIVRKIIAGETHPEVAPRQKQRHDEYLLIASATFRIFDLKWEPQLTIVSRRAENKGARQEFEDGATALKSNGGDTAQKAVQFALQLGERMILGFVPGLTV